MHWNNCSSSTRVAAARVEEDDEHRHDDEEAQGPQEVVQEDVHLRAAAVVRSLPDLGKISSETVSNDITWVDRDLLGSRVCRHQILLWCPTYDIMIMGQITVC